MTIIDVRTPLEFVNGNIEGSINIPLNEIYNQISKIKSMPPPIILCCASGIRSEQATAILTTNGVDCKNGGSWIDVRLQMNSNLNFI